MPKRDGYSNGVPCWVDLMTTDRDGAREFYSKLFGWQLDDMPAGPEMTYTMATKDGSFVCGLGDLPQEMAANGVPPSWNTYISSDDCDLVAKKASELGATIVAEPMDVMDNGRLCFIVDPQGAAFGVWQPKSHRGAQLVNEPSTLTWNELMTNDLESSKGFYKDLFGWEAQTDKSGEVSYTTFLLEGKPVAGCLTLTPEMGKMPPVWGTYFAVSDINATCDEIKSLGGQVLRPPFDTMVGPCAVVMDPQGAAFMVVSLNEWPTS
jgi:hypothetical protein